MSAAIDPTPLSKSYATVDGKQMAYHERGEGDAIVFLHGNPTSSYLWRNIVPHVETMGRCVVPDLIGQGDSDKLDDTGPDSYTFVEHRSYLDGLLDQLDLGDEITLVVHDWGSALPLGPAKRWVRVSLYGGHRAAGHWAQWPDAARGIFRAPVRSR